MTEDTRRPKVLSISTGRELPPPEEPYGPLVAVLEDALELARRGELRSLVATGVMANGERMSLYSQDPMRINVVEMLGAIAWLEHEYVARAIGTVVSSEG